MPNVAFIAVDVEPCAACEDGVSLRFKRAADDGASDTGGAARDVSVVAYESEAGLAGRWRVRAVDSDDDASGAPVRAVKVEDSSDGVVWLLAGGTYGLRLVHDPSGAVAREPYLVLSLGAYLG